MRHMQSLRGRWQGGSKRRHRKNYSIGINVTQNCIFMISCIVLNVVYDSS